MNYSTSHRAWVAKAARALCVGCLLLSLGGVVAGCGAEKQNLTAPAPAGAPPAGGDPQEYMRNMQRIQQEQGGGAPAMGRPGMGGGPPMGPNAGPSGMPGDSATQPAGGR